ncbi:MAG: hypothetical protein P0Y60_17870 [Candidatus Microbacterium colombiense]|nr:MAG: hypothetical protein P0Y60_17870 [Microbacterium sp.]
MFVSAEIIAIIISAVGLMLTMGTMMLAGFAWCVRRIDAVDQRLGARIDAVAADVNELKISVAELKISVARLEGPPRHLLVATR